MKFTLEISYRDGKTEVFTYMLGQPVPRKGEWLWSTETGKWHRVRSVEHWVQRDSHRVFITVK